jgi:galactokinase
MNAWSHLAETYGRQPEGCWAAPGRVNVLGEYPDLNDRFVLPIAIPRVTVVVGRALLVGLSSAALGRSES